MKVGVPKETVEGERRVALIPDVVKSLADKELDVVVESGAGEESGHPDDEYTEAGAEIGDPWGAEIVAHVAVPTADEIGKLGRGQILIGHLAPLTSAETNKALASAGVTSFAMEAIPRITRAQAMDALSSQANVAGYAAALLAAREAGRFFPMMTTAAGTVAPAKVLVLGAGVAGLQAIATAKRLGAVVIGLRHPPRRLGADRQRSAAVRSSSTSSPTPRTRAATRARSPTRRTSRSARRWPRTPASRT